MAPDAAKLASLCTRWKIRRLRLFGSFARNEARPDSDVDLLVEFHEGYYPGWDIIDMEAEFSRLFDGRRVQIVDPQFLNRWIREQVLGEAVDLYAAA